MANTAHNAIFQIGAFNTRVVRELAGLPEPVRQLRAVEDAATELGGGIRIHAAPLEAAQLMRTIVSLHRFDVALNEEDGHSHVDVRAGEGVLRAIVDLVVSAIESEQLTSATVCIGKRSLSFSPSPPDDSPVLAA